MKRLAVTGGRGFSDTALMDRVLSAIHKKHGNFILIVGRCPTGADFLAEQWAIAHNIEVDPYPAKWKTDGRAAGPIRNQRMIDEGRPDALAAFFGGAGTADMVRRCKKAGLPIWQWS